LRVHFRETRVMVFNARDKAFQFYGGSASRLAAGLGQRG
jgi:hypothetical protein